MVEVGDVPWSELRQIEAQPGDPGGDVGLGLHDLVDVERRQAHPIEAAQGTVVHLPGAHHVAGDLPGRAARVGEERAQGAAVGDAVLVDRLLGADHVAHEARVADLVDGLDVGHVAGVEAEQVDGHGGALDGAAQLRHGDVAVGSGVVGDVAPAVAVIADVDGEVVGRVAPGDLLEEPLEGLSRAEVLVGPARHHGHLAT